MRPPAVAYGKTLSKKRRESRDSSYSGELVEAKRVDNAAGCRPQAPAMVAAVGRKSRGGSDED